MNYFDWLRITRQEDTKKHFIDFLISQKDYTTEEAKKYADFIYNNGRLEEIEENEKCVFLILNEKTAYRFLMKESDFDHFNTHDDDSSDLNHYI